VDVSVAAVDLGASSGRVIVGEVGPHLLALRTVARFGNDPVRLPDGLHWNAVELYRQVVLGLRAAVASTPGTVSSIGVDSWAIDYALLSGNHLLGQPFHYRDERSASGVESVEAKVARPELYRRNGLQFLPFNTLYQLAADPLVAEADHALLIPDLIAYWLTGQLRTERTNASTTGLLEVHTRRWDEDLMARLGLDADLFPRLMDPGDTVGVLLPDVAGLTGGEGLQVTAVGSHDTPVVTDASRAANFTNEGGVDATVRFLTNVMGTWLLSESVRTWERAGHEVSLTQLLAQAAEVSGDVPVFDVQDPRFVPPGDMPSRILAYCKQHSLPAPDSRPALVRSIVESLAEGFSRAVEQAAELSGRKVGRVHLVGGGSLNSLLCQATANRCGRPILAGPAEATAIGNVLVQGRALGAISGDLESLRALVASTQDLTRYTPTT
jgi:rhamnulokinase